MITTEDVEYEDWINRIGVPDGVDPKEFASMLKQNPAIAQKYKQGKISSVEKYKKQQGAGSIQDAYKKMISPEEQGRASALRQIEEKKRLKEYNDSRNNTFNLNRFGPGLW